MPTSKIKGLDEQTLEGGVGSGAGGRSGVTSSNSKLDNVFGIEGKALNKARGANEKRLEQRINDMTPKERASLDDIGKQFETLSPMAQRAQDKIAKVNAEQKSSRSYKPTENTVLGKRELSYSELSDAQRAALTPRQRKQLGADLDPFAYKAGGAVTASRRADGIAQRGKTKGRMC
jgi:hypothetical protein